MSASWPVAVAEIQLVRGRRGAATVAVKLDVPNRVGGHGGRAQVAASLRAVVPLDRRRIEVDDECRVGVAVQVPTTVVAPPPTAEAITGKFWRPFDPVSRSPGSLSRTGPPLMA